MRDTADATARGEVMTAIWQESPANEWTILEPTGFPDEKTLHDLAAAAPQLLPLSGSPRVIVLGRQVLLGSGFADLLAKLTTTPTHESSSNADAQTATPKPSPSACSKTPLRHRLPRATRRRQPS
jgi:hypothetical protein